MDNQLDVSVLARAKRERVVQDEVEKANPRPTDPTRHPKRLTVNLTRNAKKLGVHATQKYVLLSKFEALLN